MTNKDERSLCWGLKLQNFTLIQGTFTDLKNRNPNNKTGMINVISEKSEQKKG